MVQAETIRAAIAAYFAANNAGDAEAVARLFAADARAHRVPGGAPVEGREAVRQLYAQLLGAYARVEAQVVQSFIAGNGAAVLYRGTFTARSGKAAVVDGINVYTFTEAGEIAEINYYWDPAPLGAISQG
jgi:steroid delta-isomerase